jgi:hypothetical protein
MEFDPIYPAGSRDKERYYGTFSKELIEKIKLLYVGAFYKQ